MKASSVISIMNVNNAIDFAYISEGSHKKCIHQWYHNSIVVRIFCVIEALSVYQIEP